MAIFHLNLYQVLALHTAVMAKAGRTPAPVLNQAGLESAVNEAKLAAEVEGADALRQAAILAAGICGTRVFAYGNELTAYIVIETLLFRNGVVLAGDGDDLAEGIELITLQMPPTLDEVIEQLERLLRTLKV